MCNMSVEFIKETPQRALSNFHIIPKNKDKDGECLAELVSKAEHVK